MMTSLERIERTLLGETVDRVPVVPEVAAVTGRLIGKTVREYVTDGKILAQCQLAGQAHFQYDAVIAFADLCVEAEAIGCELEFPENNYPYVKQPVMHSINDLSRLSVPDPNVSGRMPEVIKAVGILKENLGGQVPVVAHALAPLTIASRIMDIEKMLYMIVDEPGHFRELLNYTTEVALAYIKSILKVGIDCIIMFDPSCSPAVLPGAIFREFELPNLINIYNFTKDYNPNIINWFSVAGATHGMIKDLDQAKIDIFTIDSLVPLDVAYELSSSMCFNGNIKPLSFVNESPEDIYSYSSDLIKGSLEQGRFLLGSGCEIPPNSRLENIETLVRAASDISKDFKVYGVENKNRSRVRFLPYQKTVYADKGNDLHRVAADADIGISRLCNTSGACGACIVRIENGKAGELTKREKILFTDEQKKDNYRLACQVSVFSDIDVFVPLASRVQTNTDVCRKDMLGESFKGSLEEYGIESTLRAIEITSVKRSKTDSSSYLDILFGVIGEKLKITPSLLSRLPLIINSDEDKWYAIIDDKSSTLLDFSRSFDMLGVAVDIGTTNIAVCIHDLTSGNLITYGSKLNPQCQYGDNIISRAEEYIKKGTNFSRLRCSLSEGINSVLLSIANRAEVDIENIYKVVIVGNSIVHHMFLDLDLQNLVRSPFIPVVSSSYEYANTDKDDNMRLLMNNNGLVYCPPILNGFVGSDVSVGILASGLHKAGKLTLFIDLGTNGEIVLGNSDRMLVASVAAGPAFETSHLSGGKRAASGVIYAAGISDGFTNHYKTYDGKKPSGLCGSAVIDIVASFLRLNLIDSRGRFITDIECPNMTDAGYVFVHRRETAYFDSIVITQKDIEEVQKAKGAIKAGIVLLMQEYGVKIDQVDRVVLTGAFGMTVNLSNAICIGLIPEVPENKVEFIPNAAGIGARLCLLSKGACDDVGRIKEKVKHINLANHDQFGSAFIDSMLF